MDPDLERLSSGPRSKRERGPEQNPYYRLALTIICLVAAGGIIVSGMNVVAYCFKCRHDHADIKIGRCLYLSIPFVIGLVMLIRCTALARRLEQMLED